MGASAASREGGDVLGLIVLAACVWWGVSLLRLAGIRLRPEERLVVGTVAGLATGFWLVYLIASAAGELGTATLVASAALLAGGSLAARARPRAEGLADGWFIRLAVLLGLALLWMNVRGVMATDAEGNLLAAEHVWADTPFHAAIITSFAHGANFPPEYPMALGQPLGYPFLVDFGSAILHAGGLGLRWSIIAVNIPIQLAFYCGVALLAHRLTGSRRASILAAVVLFALGNFGFLAVPRDVRAAGGVWDWLKHLPWSYTGDALGQPGRDRLGTGLYLGNPTFIFFMPRRSGAFGLATGVALLILLAELLERRRAPTAVVAGVLIGLLPRIHGHTLLAVAVFAAFWFALEPARRALPAWGAWLREWRAAAPAWLLMSGVALAVAVPQLAAISEQTGDFVKPWLGWTGEPHEAFTKGFEERAPGAALRTAAATLIRFWVLNGGVLLFAAVPALRRGGRATAVWYAPFAALWVIGNVVLTTPWEWDNNNFFVYWQLGTTVVVAALLAWLLSEAPWRIPREAPDRLRRLARVSAGVLLVAGLVVGGLLSLLFAAQTRHRLWAPGEVAFANAVRDRTPPDAAILTGNGHTHPVIALSGRRTYMGFVGWLSTHGLDWSGYESRLERMLRGDTGLMRDVGIDYAVVGPWERGFARDKQFDLPRVFDDASVFEEVVRRTVGGEDWRLLRLRPAAR